MKTSVYPKKYIATKFVLNNVYCAAKGKINQETAIKNVLSFIQQSQKLTASI